MLTILYLVLAALVIILLYFFVIRPWQLTWEATKAEATQTLIGDDIVQKPHFVATRAITIPAGRGVEMDRPDRLDASRLVQP